MEYGNAQRDLKRCVYSKNARRGPERNGGKALLGPAIRGVVPENKGRSKETATVPVPDSVIPGSAATLTIVRLRAYAGALGGVEIQVDGELCGVVDNGDFAVVRCRPGIHDVVAAQFGRYSQTVRVTVATGTQAEIVCRCKMPLEWLSRVRKVLIIVLALFALLYAAIPAVKLVLARYEQYWGPILLVTIGVTMVLWVIEFALINLYIHMSEPGQFLELAEREPIITDEQIRSKLAANPVGNGNL